MHSCWLDSPDTEHTHVVCNAPLIAPIPLPYHSPTFLQFDLLPDINDDLSYPPYTHRRPPKRKRTSTDLDDNDDDHHDLVDSGGDGNKPKRRLLQEDSRSQGCRPMPLAVAGCYPQWNVPISARRCGQMRLPHHHRSR